MTQTRAVPPAPSLVELSHVVEDGMVTYPGLPGPSIGVHLTREASRSVYAPGTEFEIGRITLVANTGTYLDAPRHRFADGDDLADLALSKVAAVAGVVLDVRGTGRRGVEVADLEGIGDVVEARALLLLTGWSRHWRTDVYGAPQAPYLSRDGARWLADAGVALVGIDSVNIDDTADGERPAHTTLLARGIPVLEHLCNVEALPRNGFELHAAPVAVRGMGTFPVRAYAVVRQNRPGASEEAQ